MKKYTIKDNLGNKKTIYAKDLAHALKIADSSLNDSTYELYLGNNFSSDDWPQIRNTIKRYGLYVGEYRKGMQTITVRGDRKNIEKLLEYFGHHKGYSKEYNNIKDSIKDDIDAVRIVGIRYNKYVVMDKTATKVLSPKFDDVDDAYDWIKKNYPRAKVLDSIKDETVYYESSKTGVEVVYKNGWYRLRKDGKYSDFKTSDLKNAKSIADKEHAMKSFRWLNDSIKDEANLPTTIQALVNDEEAAIKAYEVAIKNLEGKIDDTARQVLINIMKDERRHVENLYAILNGQVTEKNLEDSKIKDEIITIGNTEYRLYSRYGSYHLDELKTNDRVADFDTYSEAMAAIRQWKKLGYVTDSNDDKITEKNLEDSIKDATLQITVRNQQEYREIDSIAEKLHLGFYETTGNKAILEGSVKDLEEYVDLVWGGDASIKRQIKR